MSERPTGPVPRPLTADEDAVLRALARAAIVIPRVLDADLEREHGMQLTEYLTLMHLSEEPARRMRMTDLAVAADLSLSGMTRVVSRLEARSLVRRERCAEDARGWHAVLTDDGLRELERAWPVHLASVRRQVFDHLGGVDLLAFADALRRLAPDAPCPGQQSPGQQSPGQQSPGRQSSSPQGSEQPNAGGSREDTVTAAVPRQAVAAD